MICFRFPFLTVAREDKWYRLWDPIGCLCSFPPPERRYLHDKRLHVVNNKWLQDSVGKQMKLPESAYYLKPDTLEELQIGRG